jgi:hypothetical protein
MEPGIYPDLANEDYHKADGISSSSLKTIINKTPAHFIGEERKGAQHFDIGSAIHDALIEPHTFKERNVRGPADRRGNKWKDALEAAEQNGKTLLVESDYDKVAKIVDAVMAKPGIASLLKSNSAIIENSAFWHDEKTHTLCKVRPDLYIEQGGIMLDIKSTVNAEKNDFARSIYNFGYYISAPYYMDGWKAAGGGETKTFYLIAIEKEPPFEAAIYRMDDDAIELCRSKYQQALHLYATCKTLGKWPGYDDKPHVISLPRWAA